MSKILPPPEFRQFRTGKVIESKIPYLLSNEENDCDYYGNSETSFSLPKVPKKHEKIIRLNLN